MIRGRSVCLWERKERDLWTQAQTAATQTCNIMLTGAGCRTACAITSMAPGGWLIAMMRTYRPDRQGD